MKETIARKSGTQPRKIIQMLKKEQNTMANEKHLETMKQALPETDNQYDLSFMPNQEHLDILNQGVEAWNQWRQENDAIRPNLRGASLSNINLRGINLSNCDLTNASLYGADLIGVKLNGADLSGANLMGASLRFAYLIKVNLSHANLNNVDFTGTDINHGDLSRADLSFADLSSTNLSGAKLRNCDLRFTDLNSADLTGAKLRGAKLRGADFSKVTIGHTQFTDVDLSEVKGIDAIEHWRPSSIGIDTIYNSNGLIPEAFLKGAGIDDTFIEYINSLLGKPIRYYSCFISYSSKADAFARRLYESLQSNNVRCWFAPEDLKWGEHIRSGIDEAIRKHDKLLLILSKYSVASGWVEREVRAGLAREKKEKRTVLFPVRVDGAVFKSPFDWATEIRHERNIGDFIRWKDHDEYQKAFARLLRDLKTSS